MNWVREVCDFALRYGPGKAVWFPTCDIPGRPSVRVAMATISRHLRQNALPLEARVVGQQIYLIHAKCPMHSDPRLRRIFLRLNRRYFGGRVPRKTRVVWRMPGRGQDMGQDNVGEFQPCIGGRPLILMHPHLARRERAKQLRETLVHEMAHAMTWMGSKVAHGTRFQREESRLGRLGALRPRYQRRKHKRN